MTDLSAERANQLFAYDSNKGTLTRKIATHKFPVGTTVGCLAKGRNDMYYIKTKVDSKPYSLHRIIWLMRTGEWPESIDHINGDGTDNRWCNLRNVSHRENCQNRKLQWNNSTGVNGICWHSRMKLWVATIGGHENRELLYQGRDFFEACCHRKAAENRLGFHENHGRKA